METVISFVALAAGLIIGLGAIGAYRHRHHGQQIP